jgi:hypothetical protein
VSPKTFGLIVLFVVVPLLARIWVPHIRDWFERRERRRRILARLRMEHEIERQLFGPRSWASIEQAQLDADLDFEPNGVAPPFSVRKAMEEWSSS